jgi:hypothetical protein
MKLFEEKGKMMRLANFPKNDLFLCLGVKNGASRGVSLSTVNVVDGTTFDRKYLGELELFPFPRLGSRHRERVDDGNETLGKVRVDDRVTVSWVRSDASIDVLNSKFRVISPRDILTELADT